ncbi:MAG: exo-alpha-sialidase [Candidatus Heimdallarchaeota archaeon]|nr:MAG: exo-alpha-sialidase [Candidatus Heimdallarchaeota archaeon]
MLKWSKKLLYSFVLLNVIFIGTMLHDTNVSSQAMIKIVKPMDVSETPNSWEGGNYFSENSRSDNNFGSYLTPDYEILGYYGWEAAEVIEPNNPLNDIKLTLDAEDNVHVFWSGRFNGDWVLYHNVKNNMTGVWSDRVIIGNTASEYFGLMDVKTDSEGRIHIVWLDNQFIKYRKYDNGTWNSPSTVGYGELPRLQLTNESEPKVVYVAISSIYNIDFYFSDYNNETNSWNNHVFEGYYSYSFSSSNFNYHITYEGGQERSFFIQAGVYSVRQTYYIRDYYLYYDLFWKENTTAPFTYTGISQTFAIPSAQYYVPKPNLFGTADGNLHLVYVVQTAEDEYSIMYQKITHEGATSPITLSTKAAQSCFITGILDSFGRIVLLWNWVQYTGGTTAGLYMKTFSPNTGSWSSDVLLNPGHGYSQYPDLAVDSDGNVHMAWVDQVDDIRTIYYRKGWNDADEDGLMNFEERGIYGTDPNDPDTDDDQMLDGEEIANGFDPFNPDEDTDGMLDGYEFHYGLDPYTNDSLGDLDNDSLLNIEEFLANTYPNDNDSDDDFVNDYDEVKVYFSDPLNTDSDDDLLDDGLEINILGSNPISNDTDGDSMLDYWEYSYGLYVNILVNDSALDPDGEGLINLYEYQWNLHPGQVDYEGDGLDDYQEVIVWGTNPTIFDTDKDGYMDGEEVNGIYASTNPAANATGYVFTNPTLWDTDGDFISDLTDIAINCNPLDNDTDDDLMSDGYEYYMHLDPLNASDATIDLDGDTLTNYEEFLLWTDPKKTDTDGDKFWDNEELVYGTDPTLYDTDGDGLNDYDEIIILHTNATNPDTDYDGLNDYLEVHVYGSDPHIVDSDGDTLTDGDEVYIYNTHPANKDTDGDLVDDNVELGYGSDPTIIDTDFDGMDDYFEWLYGLDPVIDDSALDADNDGISNGEEFIHNANPLVNDTDLDGLTDYEEIAIYYTLANIADTDGDGISDYNELFVYYTLPHDPDTDDDRIIDGDEIALGTNPLLADSDSDGIDDGQELLDETDPLDPNDNKNNIIIRYILIIFGSVISCILVYYIAPFFLSKLSREEEVKWVREGILWRKKKSDAFLNNHGKQEAKNQE